MNVNLLGKWNGQYRYISTRLPLAMRESATNFILSISEFDGENFKGTVTEDSVTGGMNGMGMIQGIWKNGSLKFVKKMPFKTVYLPDGTKMEFNQQHRKLYYQGTWKTNRFEGTWKLKLGVGFLYKKFVIYPPSKGTWTMHIAPFTLEQIKDAHSKVKSGADFPGYIQSLKELGVTAYDAFVADGHTHYFGIDQFELQSTALHAPITIAQEVQFELFQKGLLAHQQGETDYPTFIQMCAETGISIWNMNLTNMTCTYFDQVGNPLLVEQIPSC
jgi:uncharacterized protein YbcV (DUF1398 family)